jgi:spermidine/putrescine transport system substrate-binding protein
MNGMTQIGVRFLTRKQFIEKMGWTIASLGLAQFVSACAGARKEGQIGGRLDFYSWEGYDCLSATEQWRKEHGVDLKSAYIASSEDTPAKVLSPAGKGIDLITYAYAYYQAWSELGLFTEFTVDEVPNIKRMFKFFQEGEYWRTKKGTYIGVPLTWLNYVCNYRADLVEAPKNWSDLLDPKFKGKIAIVEDPAANILVASAVLGIQTDTMTRQQLEEVKKFLLGLKANAKTIAPSYGDLSNLLISGEVVATFVGWGALDTWAAAQGVNVKSVLPQDGIVFMVDAYAIPPTCDNRPTALAWVNLMLSDEVQLYVVNELLTATVCPDVVKLIKDDNIRAMYDYEHLEELLRQYPLRMFPPPQAKGDRVGFADWMKMWEEVKAG